MEAIVFYLLKSSVVSGVFILMYYLTLRNESFYKLSRFYLLASLLFAYIFPFIKIPIESSTTDAVLLIGNLQTTINQFTYIDDAPITDVVEKANSNIFQYWWLIIPIAISILFIIRLIKNLLHLKKTIKANEKINQPKFTLVLFKQHYTFSFFRYIFISQNVWHSPKGNSIVNHELSHLKHKHSLDRLLMEILLIAFWMNPFIYLYRKALEEVHEFQADRDATKETSLKDYFGLVLQQSSAHNYSPLMSPFSYKLIKKRIKMANYKSNPLIKFKLIIPILIGIVILTTSAINFRTLQTNTVEQSILDNENKVTTSNFILPVSNATKIIGWGYRYHPIYDVKKLHTGVDFKAPINTPVYASQDGTVSLIETKEIGYGKRIDLQHDNDFSTLYAHLNSFKVKEGQKVKQGDIIGYVGNTGASTAPHLHFEVHKNGKVIDPTNLLSNLSLNEANVIITEEQKFSSPILPKDLTKISSGYGMRKHPITKEMKKHNGVDYVAPLNTEILAIGDGVVRKVNHAFEEGKGHGRFIIVDHENGYSSLYSQLNDYKVKEGQKVKAGDVVGLLGSSGMSTGPHLHLEIKKDGQHIDPESVIK